ncbi:hypothetical protein [Massilia alkalitolerans]|uniref:hypothetical protein n=1 Tax=Massilia alkalitolerans TaxID=286638 RepID=UPI0028AC0418|nr:hypothetical protein [Massilia alkalitolerans]
MTLIPDALELVRELIPNSASQLFLHAERAPEDVHEANVLGVLPPPNGYFYGDSVHFGVPPAEARARAAHVLEVRLGPAANPLGTLTLLRDGGPAFDTDDEEDLGRVAKYFDYALHNVNAAAAAGNGLSGVIEDEAMLLATTNGDILFLSDSAGALLDQLASQEQQVFDRRSLPPFCLRLVESVVYGERYPWRLPAGTLELAGGVLEARAVDERRFLRRHPQPHRRHLFEIRGAHAAADLACAGQRRAVAAADGSGLLDGAGGRARCGALAHGRQRRRAARLREGGLREIRLHLRSRPAGHPASRDLAHVSVAAMSELFTSDNAVNTRESLRY